LALPDRFVLSSQSWYTQWTATAPAELAIQPEHIAVYGYSLLSQTLAREAGLFMEPIALAYTFLLVTLGLAYVSRASLLHPRSHGFYRFLAWEAILALMLINLNGWFRDPFSWNQLISWFLLGVSLFLVIHGALLLKRLGKADAQREDASLLDFEKTTSLVIVGAYRYIRHPLYSSLLFLAWGFFFKDPSWPGGFLALAATLFLVAAAKMEEVEDIRFFGPAYRDYMKETRMFIPFLF
jgi:protein-S-isoprenylcysteine O-methyltransferase Ste14